MKKYSRLTYIILALGITWLLWIPALLLASSRGYPLPTIDYLMQHGSFQFINGEHGLIVVLFSLAVYGPLIGALVAAWLEGGRRRLAEWIAPLLRVRVAARWYVLVLLIALSVALLPLLVGALVGLVKLRPAGSFPAFTLVFSLFIYQLLTSGLGEEPGWRGYLLPSWQASSWQTSRWQASHGQEKAIWWTGLVWALWHFPFTIYYTLQGAPDLVLTSQLAILIPSLLGQTMSLIGMTYIYAWLLNGSRSLWIAVLLHALGNTFNAFANALVSADPIISLAIGAMPWLVVLVLEKTMKQPRLDPTGA